jgi:hypothetical protein
MRWLPAVALLVLTPGCLQAASTSGGLFGEALDCSTDQQVVVSARKDVLMPADMPRDVRDSFSEPALVTVHAREGQTLHAVATWAEAGGEVAVQFDGPWDASVQTDNTWSGSGEVSAGEYTLELTGSPMAFEVTYTLYLAAIGCTPADE